METQEKGIAIVVEKEVVKPSLPKVVTLYFSRADNPAKQIEIKTTIFELFENVLRKAAKMLNLHGEISVTGGGTPINWRGKRVKDIITEYSTISFELASVDMLGCM